MNSRTFVVDDNTPLLPFTLEKRPKWVSKSPPWEKRGLRYEASEKQKVLPMGV